MVSVRAVPKVGAEGSLVSSWTTSTHEVTARIFLPLHGPLESRWPWESLVAETSVLAHEPSLVRALTSTLRWSELEPDLMVTGRTDVEAPHATPGRSFSVALASALARESSSAQECWFFLWEGYAGETDDLERMEVPAELEDLSRRSGGLVAYSASIWWLGDRTAVDEHVRLPVFVWPDDGSFLLACPIYHDSIYVSCSSSLAERLRGSGFEVVLIDRDVEVPGEGD